MSFIKERAAKFGSQNKQMLVESALAFIVRILAAIAAFFMNIVVARQLGAYQAGNFFLCIAFITIASVFFSIGGNNQIIRFAGIYSAENKWRHVKHAAWQIAKWVLIISIFFSVILIFSCDFIAAKIFTKKELAPTLFWMLLSVPVYTLTTLLAFALQGIKKVTMSICLQGVFIQVALALLVWIFKPNKSDVVAKFYFFISIGVLVIAIFSWIKFFTTQKSTSTEKPELPSTFWNSMMTLWIFSVLGVAIQWGGQFIAGIFCNSESLAQLAVAQRTSMLVSFILVAVNLVTVPKFASLYSQGRLGELKKYAINSTRLMVFFATPIVLIMLLFPHYILMLFGKGFDNGTFMLRILVLGQYVNVLTGSVSYLLMMSGHVKELNNITMVGGVASIILNIILIKIYGVSGAAVAIAVSIALQNLLAAKMVIRKLGFNTLAIWNWKE